MHRLHQLRWFCKMQSICTGYLLNSWPHFSNVTPFLDTFGARKCVSKHETQDMDHAFTWIRAAKVVEALTVETEIWNIERNGFGGDCSHKKWKIKEKCHLILNIVNDIIMIYIYIYVSVCLSHWVSTFFSMTSCFPHVGFAAGSPSSCFGLGITSAQVVINIQKISKTYSMANVCTTFLRES